MFVDRTVYEYDLYSITPSIIVNQDWSKRKNIENAEVEVVEKIMVQPTIRKNFFREIVTGKLIPVCNHVTCTGWSGYTDFYKEVPCSTVYIIREAEEDVTMILSHPIIFKKTKADAQSVKEYLEKHHDVNTYKDRLNYLFQIGEKYYENAASKNNYSNDTIVKKLLKTYRKNQ